MRRPLSPSMQKYPRYIFLSARSKVTQYCIFVFLKKGLNICLCVLVHAQNIKYELGNDNSGCFHKRELKATWSPLNFKPELITFGKIKILNIKSKTRKVLNSRYFSTLSSYI